MALDSGHGQGREFACPTCGVAFRRQPCRAGRSKRGEFCSIRCSIRRAGNDAPDKFWAKTSPQPNGCIYWNGYRPGGRYGALNVAGRARKAHRHAWILTHGDIPDGLSVLHRCDVPHCVNPEHLFLGTNADNVRDKVAKGRAARLAGERNPSATITDADIRALRARYRYGNLTALAAEYGVSFTYACGLVTGSKRAAAGGVIHRPRCDPRGGQSHRKAAHA
jgi:hypothetical protein